MRKAPSQGAPFATRLDSDKSSRVMSLGGSCMRRPLLGFGRHTHPVSAARIPDLRAPSFCVAAKLQFAWRLLADEAPEHFSECRCDVGGAAVICVATDHLVHRAFACPGEDL